MATGHGQKDTIIVYFETMPKMTTHTRAALPDMAGSFRPCPDLPADSAGTLEQWLSACRITPVRAERWHCTKHWHQAERRVPEVFSYWLEEGEAWYRLETVETPCRLRAGDWFMVPQQMLNEVWAAGGNGLKLYTVRFLAQVHGTVDLTALLGLAGAFPGAAAAPYRRVAETMARESTLHAPGWRLSMQAAVTELLVYLIRRHAHRRTMPAGGLLQRDMVRLQPVFDIIRHRLDDPQLRVADLARAMGASEVYLRRLLRRTTGLSPVGFLRRQRIGRACRLLRTTDLPTKAIAAQCGFEDLPFFYRTFRRVARTTPRLYREGEGI